MMFSIAATAPELCVGPGITASFTLLYAEWEDETGVDSDGFGGILGLKLGF